MCAVWRKRYISRRHSLLPASAAVPVVYKVPAVPADKYSCCYLCSCCCCCCFCCYCCFSCFSCCYGNNKFRVSVTVEATSGYYNGLFMLARINGNSTAAFGSFTVNTAAGFKLVDCYGQTGVGHENSDFAISKYCIQCLLWKHIYKTVFISTSRSLYHHIYLSLP